MRKRFRVSMITCLALLTILPLVAISDNHEDEDEDRLVKAGAYISGNSRLKAKGKVFAENSSVIGSWGISATAGNQRLSKRNTYRNGQPTLTHSVSKYASYAAASAWITGNDREGEGYSANASVTKRTDN